MADVTSASLQQWQASEAATRPNNARQCFEMFRAFWRWCATQSEYRDAISANAVESKELRHEVPSRKSELFDVLEKSHLRAWFSAVRGLDNPVMAAYLQGLLLTGARREELARCCWNDVDFRWGPLWVKDKVAAEGRKALHTGRPDCLGSQIAQQHVPAEGIARRIFTPSRDSEIPPAAEPGPSAGDHRRVLPL